MKNISKMKQMFPRVTSVKELDRQLEAIAKHQEFITNVLKEIEK